MPIAMTTVFLEDNLSSYIELEVNNLRINCFSDDDKKARDLVILPKVPTHQCSKSLRQACLFIHNPWWPEIEMYSC